MTCAATQTYGMVRSTAWPTVSGVRPTTAAGTARSSLGEIEQRTVEMHGDDAAALIRALGLMPCVLVGSSGGARVALDIVLRYPELLRGAVLSEPPLFMLDSSGAAQFQAEVRPKLQQAMAAGGPRAAVDAFFDHVCPGLWRAIDDERRDVYRANAGELMPDLQMPTHQVGRNEPSKRNEMFRLLGGGVIGDLGQMPPAQLAILPGTSHVGVLDRVDWLSSMILTFMPPTPRR